MEADLHRVFSLGQLRGDDGEADPSQVAQAYRQVIPEDQRWLWHLLEVCLIQRGGSLLDRMAGWVASEFPLTEESLYRLVVRREVDKACLLVHRLRQARPSSLSRVIGECLLEFPTALNRQRDEQEWRLNCRARLVHEEVGEDELGRVAKFLVSLEAASALPWEEQLMLALWRGKEPTELPHAELIRAALRGDALLCHELVHQATIPLWFRFHWTHLMHHDSSLLPPYAESLITTPYWNLGLDYLTYLPHGQQAYSQCAITLYGTLRAASRRRLRAMTRNFGLSSLHAALHGLECDMLMPHSLRHALYHAVSAEDAGRTTTVLDHYLTRATSLDHGEAVRLLEEVGTATLSTVTRSALLDGYRSLRAALGDSQLPRAAEHLRLIITQHSIPAHLQDHLCELAQLLLEPGDLRDPHCLSALLGWLDSSREFHPLRVAVMRQATRLLTMAP